MSREVRRVPLGWRHPTEPNPYWISQTRWALEHNGCLSQLRMPQVRFRGLSDGYPERLAEWEQEVEDLRHRRGFDWDFGVEYHLTGYQGREDSEPIVHPFWVWDVAGQAQTQVYVRDEDHLHELLTAQKAGERPDPAQYMPVFDAAAVELGWVLYETVSEGTPVTPVFATADELIEHLATIGQDWDQVPMRREAAVALVTAGGSLGSMVAVGGQLLRSDTDADLVELALAGEGDR